MCFTKLFLCTFRCRCALLSHETVSVLVVNLCIPLNLPFLYVLQMLLYLRMCLASSAGLTPNVESTAAMQQQAPAIGQFVRQLVAEGGPQTQLVVAYVDIARQLLTAFNGNFVVCCCFVLNHAFCVLTL